MRKTLTDLIGSTCHADEGDGIINGYIEWDGKIRYIYVQFKELERRLKYEKVKIL